MTKKRKLIGAAVAAVALSVLSAGPALATDTQMSKSLEKLSSGFRIN